MSASNWTASKAIAARWPTNGTSTIIFAASRHLSGGLCNARTASRRHGWMPARPRVALPQKRGARRSRWSTRRHPLAALKTNVLDDSETARAVSAASHCARRRSRYRRQPSVHRRGRTQRAGPHVACVQRRRGPGRRVGDTAAHACADTKSGFDSHKSPNPRSSGKPSHHRTHGRFTGNRATAGKDDAEYTSAPYTQEAYAI